MHKLLTTYLDKLGIDDIKNASKEERETFDRWNETLTAEDMSVEKMESFIQLQLGLIENMWENLDNKALKNERLIILHTVYHKLLKVLTSPKSEREALEKHLTSLIDNNTKADL